MIPEDNTDHNTDHNTGDDATDDATDNTDDVSDDGSQKATGEPRDGEQRRGKPAREKVMDLLARRGHSELELRQKLARFYEEDEVEDAIAFARENNWMTPPEELSERVAAELGRKKKGHRFINQFLKTKGLPVVAKDLDEEVRKGREIAQAKLGKDGPYDYEEQKKVYRLLANRGFDDETIRRVLDR